MMHTRTPNTGFRLTLAGFTDRAVNAMVLAVQEARRLHHAEVGGEHILLGLTRDPNGLAAHLLKSHGADLVQVRTEVQRLVPGSTYGSDTGGTPARGALKSTFAVRYLALRDYLGSIPLSAASRMIVEYGIEEARNFNFHYVGTQHLLLALLRVRDGVATEVLLKLGMDLEAVRGEVRSLRRKDPR